MYSNSLAIHFSSMVHAKCLLPRLDRLLLIRSCLQNFYQCSFSAAAAVLPLSNLSDDHFLPVYCVDTRPFLEMHISSGTGCGVVAQQVFHQHQIYFCQRVQLITPSPYMCRQVYQHLLSTVLHYSSSNNSSEFVFDTFSQSCLTRETDTKIT